VYAVSLPGRRFRRVYAGIRERIPQIFAIITATQYLRRAATRAYRCSQHSYTYMYSVEMIKSRSADPLSTRAYIHRELASLEMKITSYTPANGSHGGSAHSLATSRVFLPVTTVLRSPVIIMLNDSAEVRVNAPRPTLASTGLLLSRYGEQLLSHDSETVSCYNALTILLW